MYKVKVFPTHVDANPIFDFEVKTLQDALGMIMTILRLDTFRNEGMSTIVVKQERDATCRFIFKNGEWEILS